MTPVLRLSHLAQTLWPLRVAWTALPLVAGPGISGLATGRSTAVALVLQIVLWGGWGAGLVALLVPHPLSLTVLRLLVPALLVVALIELASPERSVANVMALAAAVVVGLGVYSPHTADTMVDGASYGHELRLCLRTPLALWAGPLPLAATVLWLGIVTGPLLLAARQWVFGTATAVIGWAAAAVVAPKLHALARRWLVFVPTGMVLHDHSLLSEPVLFPRPRIRLLSPARPDTTAVDLTAGAAGLVVEVELSTPVAASLRDGRRGHKDCELTSFLVAPMRPGALLRAASQRRLAVASSAKA